MGAPSVTYGIITHGRRPEKLRRHLDSLRALHIPVCEILVAGEPPADLGPDVTVVPAAAAARQGRVSELRNLLLDRARHDLAVVADDDMILHADFYKGLCRGRDFDALAVRILNPDGTRYWDWATFGGPRGHCLLEPGESDPFVYLTGGIMALRSEVARSGVRGDAALGSCDQEDVEFSRRLKRAGFRLQFNPFSTVTHDDARCVQDGPIVLRLDGILDLIRKHYAAGRRTVASWWLRHLRELWPGALVDEEVVGGRGLGVGELQLPSPAPRRVTAACSFGTKLPVRFVGPVYGRGLAAERARAWAAALAGRVWLGVVHHGADYDDVSLQALAADEQDRVMRAGARAERMQAGLAITCGPAGDFYRVNDARWTAGVVTEMPALTPARVAACNALDEVWAPDASAVQALASAGVERARLQVVAGPAPAVERLLAAESRILLSSGYAHRD